MDLPRTLGAPPLHVIYIALRWRFNRGKGWRCCRRVSITIALSLSCCGNFARRRSVSDPIFVNCVREDDRLVVIISDAGRLGNTVVRDVRQLRGRQHGASVVKIVVDVRRMLDVLGVGQFLLHDKHTEILFARVRLGPRGQNARLAGALPLPAGAWHGLSLRLCGVGAVREYGHRQSSH
jgi:hypothetical protein